jgi:hypothetical protein
MSTRGFEFAYMLDGSDATPVIRDFTLGVAQAHHIGDLVLMKSDGYVDQVTGTTTEVTGVVQEEVAAAAITAGTTKAKVAIITRNQMWRCSMDATSTTLLAGYDKTVDTADCNTIDADDGTNGRMILVDVSQVDDDGYVLAYVVFSDTTFGNA